MGQNQLFIIILSVVLVVVAIAVGVERFNSLTMDTNRDAVTADLVNYGAKAQLYFRTSQMLGGGSQNFQGFKLSPFENTNPNGDYRVTLTAPTGTAPVSSGGEIFVSATTIYIEGSGRRTGNDGTNPVKVYVTITENIITTTTLN